MSLVGPMHNWDIETFSFLDFLKASLYSTKVAYGFIIVLKAICKDVEVIGMVFQDITEFILVNARRDFLFRGVYLVQGNFRFFNN